MNTLLMAGGETLNNPANNTPLFGIVGGYSPAKGTGTVRLVLSLDFFAWEIDDVGNFIVDFPEACASELANHTASVVAKLQHLRSLEKLGCLTAAAFANDDGANPLENAPRKNMQT